MNTFFISGIGTGVGKTVAAAVLTDALGAAYWKPIQAGFDAGTDSTDIRRLTGDGTIVFPEVYKLKMPASPHIAAREENIRIGVAEITAAYRRIRQDFQGPLVVEGAGGLLVPVNDKEFMSDLARALDARLVLVSRNYLGSINHSLLTAAGCRSLGLDVAGWIFNDQYLDYEAEIAAWSGYPALFSLPTLQTVDRQSVAAEALRVRSLLGGLG